MLLNYQYTISTISRNQTEDKISKQSTRPLSKLTNSNLYGELNMAWKHWSIVILGAILSNHFKIENKKILKCDTENWCPVLPCTILQYTMTWKDFVENYLTPVFNSLICTHFSPYEHKQWYQTMYDKNFAWPKNEFSHFFNTKFWKFSPDPFHFYQTRSGIFCIHYKSKLSGFLVHLTFSYKKLNNRRGKIYGSDSILQH